MEESQTPLFSVGVIADIQYAPIPDGFSFSGTARYYRHALDATKVAFATFRDYEKPGPIENPAGVDLVINLGDIVDGKCQEIEKNGGFLPKLPPSEEKKSEDDDAQAAFAELLKNPGMLSLMEVKNAMKTYRAGKVLHLYGNHCLYNLNRTELREQLEIPLRLEPPIDSEGNPLRKGFGSFSKERQEAFQLHNEIVQNNNNPGDDSDGDGDLVGYYSYVHPPQTKQTSSSDEPPPPLSLKFVALDGYDVALLGRSPTRSLKHQQAVELMKEHNPINFAKGNGNENSPSGLEEMETRFVAFNGGLGLAQLVWLRKELEDTREWNRRREEEENPRLPPQKVVILSHEPIHPGSAKAICLLWNYDAVLEILREYSDVVVASFAGHSHKGGYVRDEISGIHFRAVEAILESKPPLNTFGVLDVYEDRLQFKGYGDCESGVYDFDHCAEGYVGSSSINGNDDSALTGADQTQCVESSKR